MSFLKEQVSRRTQIVDIRVGNPKLSSYSDTLTPTALAGDLSVFWDAERMAFPEKLF